MKSRSSTRSRATVGIQIPVRLALLPRGVANAPAYQVEISAFGFFPGDPRFEQVYPSVGFRLGVSGNVK
jgi:hypothetical protein